VLRYSNSRENEEVEDWSDRYRDADNLRFFADGLDWLEAREFGHGGLAVIGLVGHRDLPGVALRRAQSILRWDRRPSLWSHAFLIVQGRDGGDAGALAIREVTLHSRAGAFPEPAHNAVTSATLGHYASPRLDPNVALLAVRTTADEAAAIASRATERVNLERLRYDLWETLGIWQGYLWTRGTPNPLEQGVPMFSSGLIEYCYEEIALDLTPGTGERNSAPEHIWNGARWWTDAFGDFERPIRGCAVLRDRHCAVLDADELAAERERYQR
jgi:hypothetical protein